MFENKFSEEDKTKFIQFLNIIAKNAKFTLDTMQIIEYYELLSHMKHKILNKIDKNIVGDIEVHKADSNEDVK